MKIKTEMQLDLVWTEQACWEDLPVRIRQRAQGLIGKLLRQAAREEMSDDE